MLVVQHCSDSDLNCHIIQNFGLYVVPKIGSPAFPATYISAPIVPRPLLRCDVYCLKTKHTKKFSTFSFSPQVQCLLNYLIICTIILSSPFYHHHDHNHHPLLNFLHVSCCLKMKNNMYVNIESEVLHKPHNTQDVDNSASQNVRTKQPPLRKAAKKVYTD